MFLCFLVCAVFTGLISFVVASSSAQEPDRYYTEQTLAHKGPAWDLSQGALQVSDDGRFIIHQNGKPFLYLGDTAWELFHRLNREEVRFYLEKRRSQGFTVIQAVGLAEFGGLVRPNPYGHTPLLNNDPATPNVQDGPNNDYWDHVDYVVDTAAKKGLYIGFLPTWGDKVLRAWGEGPEIFNVENAKKYGDFLGKRYGDRPNIIWILGGDRVVRDGKVDRLPIWRAMAEGIRSVSARPVLMSYHPCGGTTSSKWLHKETWLDFNMQQSGHSAKNLPNYRSIFADYQKKPTKPVIDAEPRYDDHPVRNKKNEGWFDDFDVRQAAYWALFSGACGHTYGCHDIWQMYDGTPKRRCTDPRTPWREAVDLPGAWDMLHVRNLLLSRPFLGRVPAQDLLNGGTDDGIGCQRATLGIHGDYAFVYSPIGEKIRLKTDRFSKETLRLTWFNPRTGEQTTAGQKNKAVRIVELDPPGPVGRGNDWVLIVDAIDSPKGQSPQR